MPNLALPSATVSQIIGSMSAMIYSKLNRARLYSQTFVRTFEGVGTYQLLLPDWPVTAIATVQIGNVVVPAAPLGTVANNIVSVTGTGWGYRFVPWDGSLPGQGSMVEFAEGSFWRGTQNIRVTYTAGYLISVEAQTVPSSSPYTVTVLQPQGIWCRDNGVSYASSGVALVPVSGNPTVGQYVAPPDSSPGLYTFSAADEGAALLFNYSFVPADLEEACIQMVAERLSYRSRIGEMSKSLGGQETVSYMRGGPGRNFGAGLAGLPPEVAMLIWPYVDVVNPSIGAPL